MILTHTRETLSGMLDQHAQGRRGVWRLQTRECLVSRAIALVVAGGAAVVASPPIASQGIPEPFRESPMLAERVARGELPPVEDRLPEDVLVVEPVNEIGVYGGVWRRTSTGLADIQLDSRMGYEPLARWDRSGTKVVPGLAKSWEILDGAKTYVFHLRRGLKWSDGHPLTSEDFLFYFEDVLGCGELSIIWPSWVSVDGERPEILAPDPYTLVFRFAKSCGVFLAGMAYRGNLILAPKHYLRQFHIHYTDRAEIEAKARREGLSLWHQLYWHKANPNENPDLPTWKPFKIVVPPPASRALAERNPYYWKVDPEGNQLPYIDQVAYTEVQNNEIVTIKAMAGEVDFQARRIDSSSFALFMASRERGRYRVMRDLVPDTIVLYLNQHSRDPRIRELLNDRRFRAALSLAIDRDELIYLLFGGRAVPSSGVVCPLDPYYLPEYDAAYLSYDPARSNALLDEAGLKHGQDGLRRMPDGSPFRQILHVYPSEAGTTIDLWQLVAEYFREVGLEFVVKLDSGQLSVQQVCNGNNDFWAYQQPGIHWVADPKWHLPLQSTSYFAPLYGRYVDTKGKDRLGVEPRQEFKEMLAWYHELAMIPDNADGTIPEHKLELGHRILRQWTQECYLVGICRQELLTIVSDRFRNVPDHIIHDWRLATPGYIGIEQFYIVPDTVPPL